MTPPSPVLLLKQGARNNNQQTNNQQTNSAPLLLVEAPDALDDALVPPSAAVRHVEARDVHAALGERAERLVRLGRRADRAHELGLARAARACGCLLLFGLFVWSPSPSRAPPPPQARAANTPFSCSSRSKTGSPCSICTGSDTLTTPSPAATGATEGCAAKQPTRRDGHRAPERQALLNGAALLQGVSAADGVRRPMGAAPRGSCSAIVPSAHERAMRNVAFFCVCRAPCAELLLAQLIESNNQSLEQQLLESLLRQGASN